MPAPVYLSINEFDGDGVTTKHEFAFAGGYIDKSHIRARITDAAGVSTEVAVTEGMFVTDFTIDIGVPAPVGGTVRIYRVTPREEPLVDFTDRSRLTAANLDLLARQTVLGVAEAFDAGEQVSALLDGARDVITALETLDAEEVAANAQAATDSAQAAAASVIAAGAVVDSRVLRSGDTGLGTMAFAVGGGLRMPPADAGTPTVGELALSPWSTDSSAALALAAAGAGDGASLRLRGKQFTSEWMNFKHASTGGSIVVDKSGTGTYRALTFNVAGADRLTIAASGTVAVPGPLTVGGAVTAAGGYTGSGFRSRNGSTGPLYSNLFNLYWTGTVMQLWVDSTNIGSISVTSDYRAKKDIVPAVAPALERIMKLRPVTYTMADWGVFRADGVSREGFIAHELAEVVPSAVEGIKDDPDRVQSLKTDALLSVVVKGMQELIQENKELREAVLALQRK